MTQHTRKRPALGDERGIALISALLMMIVLSALAIALTASGRVEVAMGDNEETYSGARAAAESGLNHTAAIVIQLAAVPTFDADTLLRGPDGLADPVSETASSNADNNLVTHILGGTAPWTVAPGSDYSYDVRIFDDDDPRLNNGTAFSNVELTAMGAGRPAHVEDGRRFNDVNRRLVIRSTGFGPRGTTATLEQMLTPITMPALLVNGDLTMGGNASIEGSQGSVHANGNLLVDGNSVNVEQNATASGNFISNTGSWQAGELTSGGMPVIPVPDIRASNYLSEADFIMRADGVIQNAAGTWSCNAFASNQGGYRTGCRNAVPPGATAPLGWRFDSNNLKWDLNPGGGGNAHQATYYARTDVTVTGSPGTTANPLRITIIAEGDIEVTGNPDLRPEPSSEIQFVTDQDLRLAGDLTIPTAYEGRIMVREQIDFAGTIELAGQVIVQNIPSISTLVTNNDVRGTATLTYNGLIETVAFTVSGWRETQ